MTEHETSKKSGDYLITGATGNIGGRVVEHLLQAGLRPQVRDRAPCANRRSSEYSSRNATTWRRQFR